MTSPATRDRIDDNIDVDLQHFERTENVKVKVIHDYPPIPIRTMDWCAYIDGREEDGFYGYGRTREAAIRDLIENWEA